MRKILFALFSLLVSETLFSQNLSEEDIIPRSPEASNLGMYGSVEVGEYTGKPNISIPIHTVTSGKLVYPINLYYDPTGIRVNQEASWVGLGWEVSGIAGISYIAKGGNDQTTVDFATDQEWQNLFDYVNSGGSYPLSVKQEDTNFSPVCTYSSPVSTKTPGSVISSASAGLGVLDLYNVNLPNLSFKFYLDRYNQVPRFFGERNNCKIEKTSTGFLVIDGDGVKYYFQDQEGDAYLQEISNWYLSEIRHPDGDYLIFRYESFGTINSVPVFVEKKIFNSDGAVAKGMGYDNSGYIFPGNTIKNLYLTEIESTTETIDFHLSDRIDLGGNGGRKLDSIEVTSRFSEHMKTFVFDYDYFTASDEGGNYLEDHENWYGATEETISNRLKLLSLIEKGEGNKKFSFTYNEETSLPKKTSFATDHWGYFNGKNNKTFLPMLFSVLEFNNEVASDVTNEDLYDGASRGASALTMPACVLKSITYPTKGRTEFEFEPHTFSNYTVLSAQDESVFSDDVHHDIYDLNHNDGSSHEYTNVIFDLTKEQEIDLMVHLNNKNGEFDFSQLSGTRVALIALSVSGSGPYLLDDWEPDFFAPGEVYSQTFYEKFTLSPGKYQVTVNVANDLGFQGYSSLALATIEYKAHHRTEIPEDYQSMGGGLRVGKITNYDSNDDFLNSQKFLYHDNKGKTKGRLITKLRYADSRIVSKIEYAQAGMNAGHCKRDWFNIVTLDNNNAGILSSSPVNAVVGYDEVVIIQEGKNTSLSNGYTISKFHNDDDLGYFFEDVVINDYQIALNGKLITKSFFNSADVKVRVDSFRYQYDNVESDWTNVKVEKNYVGDPCQFRSSSCVGDPGGYLIGAYPYVCFSSQLKEKYSILIENSDSIISKAAYVYHPTNLQLNNEKIWKSDGSYRENHFYYPDDNGGVYSLMVAENIINPIVEKVVFNGNVETLRTRTEYTLVDDLNHIKPYKIDESRLGSAPRSVRTLDRYDGGNLVQYRNLQGINITVLWGYSGSLPIAIIHNAIYDDVSSILTDEVIIALRDESKTDSEIRTVLGALRRLLPESQVSIYTYDLLYGMTSETDPNGITNYYEYDGMGRVSAIKDFDDNILKSYKYHFQQ